MTDWTKPEAYHGDELNRLRAEIQFADLCATVGRSAMLTLPSHKKLLDEYINAPIRFIAHRMNVDIAKDPDRTATFDMAKGLDKSATFMHGDKFQFKTLKSFYVKKDDPE